MRSRKKWIECAHARAEHEARLKTNEFDEQIAIRTKNRRLIFNGIDFHAQCDDTSVNIWIHYFFLQTSASATRRWHQLSCTLHETSIFAIAPENRISCYEQKINTLKLKN